MKIIIIGTAFPLKGGLASFNERLAEELLLHKEKDVEIYTFSLQYPSFLFPGKTQLSSETAPKDLKIKVKINSINPINWVKIGNEINQINPDLILIKYWLPFMGPCFGTILRKAKKSSKTKIISILDNIIPHEKRIGDKMFTKYFIKPIDGFISMSKSVLDDLKTFNTKKPGLFIPHPVYDNYGDIIDKNTAREFLKINKDDKVILFFGYIRKYKGLDLLLEAMHFQKIKEKNIKLLIAGEYYGNEEFYEEIIEKYHLQNQIILHTDFIPNSEVKYYFSAADCVVQPYKTATQSGISQLAYHFETPMIVTNVGGLPEIVPHEKVGYVVPPEPHAISKAILDFYNKNKNIDFKKNIKIEKKKYSWSNFADKLLDFYKTL